MVQVVAQSQNQIQKQNKECGPRELRPLDKGNQGIYGWELYDQRSLSTLVPSNSVKIRWIRQCYPQVGLCLPQKDLLGSHRVQSRSQPDHLGNPDRCRRIRFASWPEPEYIVVCLPVKEAGRSPLSITTSSQRNRSNIAVPSIRVRSMGTLYRYILNIHPIV